MSMVDGLWVCPGEYDHDGMMLLPIFPADVAEQMKTFETCIDDLCVASYPKSGTTWTQQIVSQIFPELCPADKPLGTYMPFMELNIPGKPVSELEEATHRPSPRLLKTHMPPRYLASQIEDNTLKVVFVVRNLKDTLVSYYHHYKLFKPFGPFAGTWDDFFELFKAKRLCQGDYLDIVADWVRACEKPNVLLVKFEDLKADLVGGIERIAQFCGRKYTEDQLEKMAANCTFDAMKNNPNANMSMLKPMMNDECQNKKDTGFIRQGKVGGWKALFTQEQSDYVDQLCRACPEYVQLYDIQ